MDKAPHANAAKVFVNWLLSREGQISFQQSQGACDSARIDIPKEDVPPIHRRREGVKYFPLTHRHPSIQSTTKYLTPSRRRWIVHILFRNIDSGGIAGTLTLLK